MKWKQHVPAKTNFGKREWDTDVLELWELAPSHIRSSITMCERVIYDTTRVMKNGQRFDTYNLIDIQVSLRKWELRKLLFQRELKWRQSPDYRKWCYYFRYGNKRQDTEALTAFADWLQDCHYQNGNEYSGMLTMQRRLLRYRDKEFDRIKREKLLRKVILNDQTPELMKVIEEAGKKVAEIRNKYFMKNVFGVE